MSLYEAGHHNREQQSKKGWRDARITRSKTSHLRAPVREKEGADVASLTGMQINTSSAGFQVILASFWSNLAFVVLLFR